jgi:hypothetical protein
MNVSSHSALLVFLQSAYTSAELHELAALAFEDCRELAYGLPGLPVSVKAVASALVEQIPRYYTQIPTTFWTYLYCTRPTRRAEIDRLVKSLAPGAKPPRASAPRAQRKRSRSEPSPPAIHEVRLPVVGVKGFDVVAFVEGVMIDAERRGSSIEREFIRAHFSGLRAGHVRGAARRLALAWSDRKLHVEAYPSLVKSAEALEVRATWDVPLVSESASYYPMGRRFITVHRETPCFDVGIEWLSRGRRLRLSPTGTDRCALIFEFV